MKAMQRTAVTRFKNHWLTAAALALHLKPAALFGMWSHAARIAFIPGWDLITKWATKPPSCWSEHSLITVHAACIHSRRSRVYSYPDRTFRDRSHANCRSERGQNYFTGWIAVRVSEKIFGREPPFVQERYCVSKNNYHVCLLEALYKQRDECTTETEQGRFTKTQMMHCLTP